MRESIHDYALKVEPADDLEKKIREKGFPDLLSERIKRGHWPSELDDCLRKRYYGFKGVKATNATSFKGKSIFAFGDFADDFTAKLTMRARIFVEEEFSYTINHPRLKYPLSGRIDIVVEEDDGTFIPLEVKTIKGDSFYDKEYKFKDGFSKVFPGAVTEPKFANVCQLMTYIYHMGTPYGYLVYWNKDNQDMKIHKVYWCEELFNDAIEDCVKLEKHLELDTVPPRPKPIELKFYQRDATYGKKGELKGDSLSFPCGWRDRATGETVLCKFFDYCYRDEILNDPTAGEEIKKRVERNVKMQDLDGGA